MSKFIPRAKVQAEQKRQKVQDANEQRQIMKRLRDSADRWCSEFARDVTPMNEMAE